MTPNQKIFGKSDDTTIYNIFGCRMFAHASRRKQGKDHDAITVQCIYVRINRTSYPGYLLNSPELHTIFTTGNATFHLTIRYDGTATMMSVSLLSDTSTICGVDGYKYLEGTNHIDPNNGLLYKVTSVEQKTYRGQGTFVVDKRVQALHDGRVSSKCDIDGYHVRDIEKYYEEQRHTVFIGNIWRENENWGSTNFATLHAYRIPSPIHGRK